MALLIIITSRLESTSPVEYIFPLIATLSFLASEVSLSLAIETIFKKSISVAFSTVPFFISETDTFSWAIRIELLLNKT